MGLTSLIDESGNRRLGSAITINAVASLQMRRTKGEARKVHLAKEMNVVIIEDCPRGDGHHSSL